MAYCAEVMENEISLAEDECCIVFDFGCYFPYSNFKDLAFDFSLGMENFSDYKLNHRYPNKCYQTISKRTGKKVSKIGYSYIMKLAEQESPFLLCLKVGMKWEEPLTMIFPVFTSMTKEKPVCGLSFRFCYDDGKFSFATHKRTKNGIASQYWYNFKSDTKAEQRNAEAILLNSPSRVGESRLFIYGDIIKPFSVPLTDLLFI